MLWLILTGSQEGFDKKECERVFANLQFVTKRKWYLGQLNEVHVKHEQDSLTFAVIPHNSNSEKVLLKLMQEARTRSRDEQEAIAKAIAGSDYFLLVDDDAKKSRLIDSVIDALQLPHRYVLKIADSVA